MGALVAGGWGLGTWTRTRVCAEVQGPLPGIMTWDLPRPPPCRGHRLGEAVGTKGLPQDPRRVLHPPAGLSVRRARRSTAAHQTASAAPSASPVGVSAAPSPPL